MMNKMRLSFSVILILCLLSRTAVAQPFADEIRAFTKTDSERFPPKNAILFVGSSSFRKWTDVQDYFPGYTIINRGFGGSTLPDVIRYANNIIISYLPYTNWQWAATTEKVCRSSKMQKNPKWVLMNRPYWRK